MARQSLLDWLMAKAAVWHAGRAMRRFFAAVERATAAQERLLAELIATGTESAFGREHHFERIRGYADFAANVPIQTYAQLAPYVERVRHGETTALLRPGERVLMFALTSGTTAEAKYIPVTPRVLADWRRGWNTWGIKALLDHRECLLRRIVQVTSPMEDHRAPSGVACGAITGLLAATQKRVVRRYYTSPLAVAGIKDATAKYYTIMRLAIPRDVAWMVTANPATLMLLAKTADEHREEMIRDIRDGTLSERMAVPGDIRAALEGRLRPDAECARRLEAVVREHGAMYPRHYWRLGFLAHWMGGTMGLYVPQLEKYFGTVPSRDIGLIASEGRMSIPVADGTPAGIAAVTSQFFEFIPAEEYGAARPSVLRSHEVREGEEYFLLLTNGSGLHRYDIGDRVRVTGRAGEAPVFEFLSRDAHTSSMTGEKLTENQVVLAMQRAIDIGCQGRACGGGEAVVDFVVAPRWGEPPYYRVYVENSRQLSAVSRQPETGDGQQSGEEDRRRAMSEEELAARLDAALGEISVEYASKRETQRLGPVEAVVLPAGTLAERDRRLREQRSRTSEQFKHQYLLPKVGMDEELAGNQVRGLKRCRDDLP